MQTVGVGARTAAYQLWNRGWLSSQDLRDQLIDRYAAVDRDSSADRSETPAPSADVS